jgi:hypothetical protein
MRSRYCPSLLGNGSVKIPTTSCVYYEITLLSLYVHTFVSFSSCRIKGK